MRRESAAKRIALDTGFGNKRLAHTKIQTREELAKELGLGRATSYRVFDADWPGGHEPPQNTQKTRLHVNTMGHVLPLMMGAAAVGVLTLAGIVGVALLVLAAVLRLRPPRREAQGHFLTHQLFVTSTEESVSVYQLSHDGERFERIGVVDLV